MKHLRIIALIAVAALATTTSVLAAGKPLKIYILVGQSNMQGQAKASTFAGMAMDPEAKSLYNKLVDENGKPKVHKDVYITAISHGGGWGGTDDRSKNGQLTAGYGYSLESDDILGPELGFGVTIREQAGQPILLIKTAWGGKSLHTDFRSPSGGPYYEFPEKVQDRKTNKGEVITAEEEIANKIEATGKYYRLMLEHVRSVLADPSKYHPAYDKDAGYEVAGFAWFQGFNDLVGPYPSMAADDNKKGGKDYSQYSHLLACFIRDVRKDLSVPNMPFAIGVLGIGGKNAGENADLFRKAMAAPAEMPEFKGNVAAVNTADFWDEKLTELFERRNVMKVQKGNRKAPEDKYTPLREKIAPLLEEYATLSEVKGAAQNKQKIDELQHKMQNILFTPEELDYMSKNRSSQDYHYLGSAKIYSRIGEALALAIVDMSKKKE